MGEQTNVTPAPTGATGADAPPEPKWLFYVISFLMPIAGVILGALYLGKPDARNKEFGKYCLVAAVINVALGVALLCCYFMFIVGYIGFVFGLIGLAGMGTMFKSALLLPALLM